MSSRQAERVEQELDRLPSLSLDELRQEWEQLYRSSAPRLSRELLLLGLAYRIQERSHGGLSRTVLRQLDKAAQSLGDTGKVEPARKLRTTLKLGAKLVREWHGHMHVVTVAQNGFEHDGVVHQSLSTIARHITGARWSGPRFFGLLDNKPAPAAQGAARD